MGGLKEKEYRSIVDNIQDGYFEIDLAGTYIYVNAAFCDLYGYSKEEIVGVNYRELTDKENARKAFRAFNQIYQTGVTGKLIDYEAVRKDGSWCQVEISASLIMDDSGKPIGFRGTSRDVTERRQMEERLRRSEERYRAIIENIEDACFEVDLKGRFTFVNDALCSNLGYTREELIGMDQSKYSEDDTVRELFLLFNKVYRTGEPVKAYSFELSRKDGTRGFCEISVSLIRNKQGEPIGFRGIARDVTERKKHEEQIRYLATHDVLTGLPNRIMFREVLQQNIDFAYRYRQQFAVLFADLDGFKIVNDTFGHEAGDMVLIECATRLRSALRASDFVARLGGDEFVILVKNVTSIENLTTLVNKVLATIREPLTIKGKEHALSASIGVSIYPQDGQDKQSLTKAADLAMYAAKEKGNNNFQFFSMGIKAQFRERTMFEESLPRAMERNELFLEYQPKLDMKTGAITGVEALLRWHNPSLGLVMPMRLIPAAESSGLIVPIGRWVLKTACKKNMAWQRQGLPRIGMAVNLSHRQLMDERLIEDIKEALAESGMDPELLELEITENLLLSYFPRIINVLNQLKELGVRLALDDFGSGYSSLAQIRHLPVDTLKIDRSIVGNIPVNRIDMAVAEAIVGIGKSLDMTIVAEGVETPEQLACLQDPFCDEVQGFYFSKPVSPEHAAELISNRKFEMLK